MEWACQSVRGGRVHADPCTSIAPEQSGTEPDQNLLTGQNTSWWSGLHRVGHTTRHKHTVISPVHSTLFDQVGLTEIKQRPGHGSSIKNQNNVMVIQTSTAWKRTTNTPKKDAQKQAHKTPHIE